MPLRALAQPALTSATALASHSPAALPVGPATSALPPPLLPAPPTPQGFMSCEPDLLGLEEVPLHVSLQAIPAKVGQGRGGRECYAVRGCRAARPRLHDITSCLAPHPPLPPYARDPPTHAAPTSLPPCLTHPHWPAPPAPPPPPPAAGV